MSKIEGHGVMMTTLVFLALLLAACGGGSTPTPDGDSEQADGDSVSADGDAESAEADSEAPTAFTLVPAFLPTTTAGTAMNFPLAGQGGRPPYKNFRIASGDAAHGDMDGKALGAWPPGLTLDATTGVLSGTPTTEGFYYVVVAADDSAGATASELYAIRIGDPQAQGTWAKRADAYQEIYEKRHLWHGLSLDCNKPDAADGNYELTTLGDASFMSGQCTMAMAFRAGVLKTDAAVGIARKQAAGWRFFQGLTGVKGLIGRSFINKNDPVEPVMWTDLANNPGMWQQGVGDAYSDYYWRSDTSRDQMTGAMLGNGALNAFVDDAQVKADSSAFLADVADHVWDHNLAIYDYDGQMTSYGDMSAERIEGWPINNSLNAVAVLAWLKEAYAATGEARFQEHYLELINTKSYLDILANDEWTYSGYSTKFYNTYMAWENWYHLLRLEDDPALRAQYADILRDTMWLNTDDATPNRRAILEHNAVKTPWYLYTTGRHDSEAMWRVLWNFSSFPDAPLRDHAVRNSDDPSIVVNPASPANEDTGKPEALYALPYAKRNSDMVVWHRTPYDLDGGADTGEERTGCDYLLPYWMGRYYGYINPQW